MALRRAHALLSLHGLLPSTGLSELAPDLAAAASSLYTQAWSRAHEWTPPHERMQWGGDLVLPEWAATTPATLAQLRRLLSEVEAVLVQLEVLARLEDSTPVVPPVVWMWGTAIDTPDVRKSFMDALETYTRKQFQELDFVIPASRITAHPHGSPYAWSLQIRGVVCQNGDWPHDEPTADAIVSTLLSALHAHRATLFGFDALQALLAPLDATAPIASEALAQHGLLPVRLLDLCRDMLRADIPLRTFGMAVEVCLRAPSATTDVWLEMLRQPATESPFIAP